MESREKIYLSSTGKKHDMKINLSTFMYRVLISTVVFQKYDSRSKIITCFQEIWVSMLGMTFETIADFNYREGLGLDTLITEAMASWSE